MKNLLIIFGISFIFTLIVALLISTGIYFICGSFWGPVFIIIGTLMFIGFFSNKIIEGKALRDVASIQYEREKLNAEQSVEVICAYCKQMNIANVKLGQRNVFKCRKCNQDNLIIFQFGSAQITKPLILPELGAVQAENKVKPDEQVPV